MSVVLELTEDELNTIKALFRDRRSFAYSLESNSAKVDALGDKLKVWKRN